MFKTNPDITIGFTGHRPSSLPWKYNESAPSCIAFKKDLYTMLEKAIQNGWTSFITGMAIGFDTIAAESQRQMNETYSAFIRGRLPKFDKPKVEVIDNLTPSVIVDQTRLGGNIRSTVGTISDIYSLLRLIFSRLGEHYAGTASSFSFNNPNGMCPSCSGIGKIMTVDVLKRIDDNKSWNEGMADLPAFHPGNWYWKQYAEAGIFPLDKKWKDFSELERNHLLYGADYKGGPKLSKKVEGIEAYLNRMLLNRDTSQIKEASVKKIMYLLEEKTCPDCK